LADEARAYAYLATIMEDGTPQVTPVWFNCKADFILINSLQGRVKDRNMRKRPSVAILIHDPYDPMRYIQVRGRVVEIVTEAAREHIHELAGKYTGTPKFSGVKPNDIRVIYKILPEKVNVLG
jgi:PPOX class probable F420-dependent enzyme